MDGWTEFVRCARAATIPAPGLRDATFAQWILESERGTSALAREHFNFGRLKWREEMKGFAMPVAYGANDAFDTYCSFDSPQGFIRGYWHFIGRPVYSGWEAFANDPQGYLNFLKDRGYTDDPAYPAKVLALLPQAQTMLGDILSPTPDEPERPMRAQAQGARIDYLAGLGLPNFETIGHLKHAFQGARPGGLEGAIVHYDAGRTRPTKGGDDSEWGAKQALDWGASQGYAFATISRSGRIYLPGNMDWLAWGHHAGKSECPVTQRSSVSRFFVGFEINSPGKVYPTADSDVFIAWFDAKRDGNGDVILNGKGQATIAGAKPEIYRKAQLRHVASQTGNIAAGSYVPCTQAQQDALVGVLLWLKARYPKTFRLDYVFGHDEVSPRRKVDPGAAYGSWTSEGPGAPLTMAHLRSVLLKAWADLQADG